jgi:UDP-N-acetylglucosamine:LPS N-acetylglucosamine transferase
LTGERFINEVTALLRSSERMSAMGAKARALAHRDAAAHIAGMAISAAEKSMVRKSATKSS